MNSIQNYENLKANTQNYLNDFKYLNNQRTNLTKRLEDLNNEKNLILEVNKIISTSANVTIDNLKTWIETILNETISTLFPEENFKIEINLSDKSGLDFIIYDGESKINFWDTGGGFVDIINILMQLIIIHLSNNEKILIADEPLKHLDSSKQEPMARLLSEISKELDIQIILITHSNDFAEASDNTITL